MSLEDRFAQHDKVVVDKYINPTNPESAVQMNTYDYVVRAVASTQAFTIKLPPVAEAKGRWYSILVRDGTEIVTIADYGDSENWNNILINSNNVHVMLYSDGMAWAVEFMGDAGEVNSVTATAPVASSGGANPVISMPAATNAVNGYATAAHITALEAKADATDLHTQGTDVALGTLGEKGTPINADKIVYRDSADSDALVTATMTEFKSFLDIKKLVDGKMTDISSAASHYCVMPFAGDIIAIHAVLSGTIATADAEITFKIGVGGTLITDSELTIAYSGSAAGDVFSSTPSALNTVAVGDVIEMITDGASTNAEDLTITFVIDPA